MDLISIGEAADQLGLRPSALRYYDERGLVSPRTRRNGRRMYGRDELRQLAFLKLAHALGIRLDTAAAVLGKPGEHWRQAVRDQAAELDRLIEQAQGAKLFLSHALQCPSEHPAQECPSMITALDRLVDGWTLDQLKAVEDTPHRGK